MFSMCLMMPFQPGLLAKGHTMFFAFVCFFLPMDRFVFGNQVKIPETFAACWAELAKSIKCINSIKKKYKTAEVVGKEM